MAKTNKVIPLSPSDVEEAKRNHLQILKETQEAGGGDKAFRSRQSPCFRRVGRSRSFEAGPRSRGQVRCQIESRRAQSVGISRG
jgi:hypothetical protein